MELTNGDACRQDGVPWPSPGHLALLCLRWYGLSSQKSGFRLSAGGHISQGPAGVALDSSTALLVLCLPVPEHNLLTDFAQLACALCPIV